MRLSFSLIFCLSFSIRGQVQVRQDVERRSRESLQPSQEVGDLPSWRDGIDSQVIYIVSLTFSNQICHGIPSTKGCLNRFGSIIKIPLNSIHCMVSWSYSNCLSANFRFDFNFTMKGHVISPLWLQLFQGVDYHSWEPWVQGITMQRSRHRRHWYMAALWRWSCKIALVILLISSGCWQEGRQLYI